MLICGDASSGIGVCVVGVVSASGTIGAAGSGAPSFLPVGVRDMCVPYQSALLDSRHEGAPLGFHCGSPILERV